MYIAEHGCKWRALPKQLGNWHNIDTRANRWAKAGVLDRGFGALQNSDLSNTQVEPVSLESTSVKVHPEGAGALKKRSTIYRHLAGRMDDHDLSGGSR